MVESKLGEALRLNPECCDCNTKPVTYISIQNGVTLCSSCAHSHKEELEQDESWCLPITTKPSQEEQDYQFEDGNQELNGGEVEWREDQIARLLVGGNKQMNEFVMNDYDLYSNTREKYTCVLAQKWREKILDKSGVD